MATVRIPPDLETTLNAAWDETRHIPGHLSENEARFLGVLAACAPAKGAIVEIGSFKGRSTVMLAKVASTTVALRFLQLIRTIRPFFWIKRPTRKRPPTKISRILCEGAGAADHVESIPAYSEDVAKSWSRPIRLLWIDGDHSYEGAKHDLDAFLPHLVPYGVVAFHDALNAFPGPIRVFVEDVLQSDQFGAAGFVHSIAWAQFRPEDGAALRKLRSSLARRAAKLIPFVRDGHELSGIARRRYKLNRFLVPHSAIAARKWASLVDSY